MNNKIRLTRYEKIYLWFSVLVACSFFFIGCGKESSPPQPQEPATAVKKEEPKVAVAPPVAETKEEKKEAPKIDMRQRNLFKPFIAKTPETPVIVVPKTPLQKYDLEQLRLTAILWNESGSWAQVEAPDGKGYTIKSGSLIGNRNGRVKRIDKDKIVVEERYTETSGEVIVNEHEIRLPLLKGEEELP